MERRLVLHSDQVGPNAVAADQRLLTSLGKDGPKVGYVSSSPDPARVYFAARQAHYEALGAKLGPYVDELTESAEVVESLFACDAIHLSGGNAFSFLAWTRRTRLLGRLRHYSDAGGALIGLSAGAILLTPSIATAILCGDSQADAEQPVDSLSLVSFGYWPHYTPGHQPSTDEQKVIAAYAPVYGCPDGSAVFVRGAVVETYGRVVLLGATD